MVTEIVRMEDLLNLSTFSILKFSATWCGPCKRLVPIVEQLQENFNTVQFCSIDIDELPELARQFKIKSVPTCVFLLNGEEVHRVVGLVSYDSMQKNIEQFVNNTL